MDDPGSIWFPLLLWLFFTCMSAFFAMCEISVVAVGIGRLQRLSQQGDKHAAMLVRILKTPGRFLMTVQTCQVISSMLCAALLATFYAEWILRALGTTPLSPLLLRVLVTILLTVLIAFFSIPFGYLLPKRIAMRDPERTALRCAGLMRVLYLLSYPFVWLLSGVATGIMLLFGISLNAENPGVTEEEILRLLDKGNEDGQIEKSEKDMINNIFAFDDRSVSEVMTHRTDVAAVPQDAPLDDIVKAAMDSGCSRLPVYSQDIDSIVGILYVKDLLSLLLRPVKHFDARVYMRKVLFVPENMGCVELFAMFKQKRVQIAVAVDEYGGTAGIVSMEDLLEAIVGNIQDEYDNEEESVLPIGENCYSLDGTLPVGDVERLFDVSLEDAVEERHDTIGGLLTDAFGGLPDPSSNAELVLSDVRFTVLTVAQRRITRVRAQKTLPVNEESESA